MPTGFVRAVVVSDLGPGLPAPVAELCRRTRRGRGARGRGLAIAAAVARAHGGRLASAPSQQGARLVLELPAAAGRQPHGAEGCRARCRHGASAAFSRTQAPSRSTSTRPLASASAINNARQGPARSLGEP